MRKGGRVEPINERKQAFMIRMTESTATMLDRLKNENCYDGRGDAIRALLDMYYYNTKLETRCKKIRGSLIG